MVPIRANYFPTTNTPALWSTLIGEKRVETSERVGVNGTILMIEYILKRWAVK